MRSLAIIPARGGSKRIPGKNIREFAGRPIIGHAIASARAAGCFDEIMVSTDDPEIAAVARRCGASVPFMRSARAADDHATTAQVVTEVLTEYQRNGSEFEAGCCLYPTAVLTTPHRLLEGQRLLAADPSLDSVVPVLRFGHPIQRALMIEGGRLAMVNPEHMSTRSQDLPASYHDAGQWYWFRVAAFLRSGRLFGAACAPVPLDEMEAQDIDNEADWRLAELKYRLRVEGPCAPC
jgi:N-acylneuraminate cytidylyltransferase